MMRTVEVLMVVIILTGAFIAASYFAVLPWPRQVSPLDLSRLSLTTLETLNSENDLSQAAFNTGNATLWGNLQIALSACLPPNVVYNLTVYNVNSGQDGTTLYIPQQSISNAASLGISSEASSYLVSSSNVTFNPVAQKIGESGGSGGGGSTLYILNCSDSNGWWITGYTVQSLAQDLYNLLSPYFAKTILIQNTTEFGKLLNGQSVQGENIRNAVIINTCGEAVPIPSSFSGTPYSENSYAYYCWTLGQKVNYYNWTWTSIVGYPFYYVTNTGVFTGSGNQNGWGIYGMEQVGAAGLNSFLRGLSGESYVTDTIGWITLGGGGSPPTPLSESVTISSATQSLMNYYGIYPSLYQTATRAVPSSIESTYNLVAESSVFNPVVDGGKTWLAGTAFAHLNSTGSICGKLVPIGLTRSTDIRCSALALLAYYEPRIYSSNYNSYDTSRLVVLQLGLVGGL
jgi:hypothetical protein